MDDARKAVQLFIEQDYQRWLEGSFGDSLRYYSLLRPLSELRIAELFARKAFDEYKDVYCEEIVAYYESQMEEERRIKAAAASLQDLGRGG